MFIMSYQPLVVPVGLVTLGRVLSVSGSLLDAYVDIFASAQYTAGNALEWTNAELQDAGIYSYVVWGISSTYSLYFHYTYGVEVLVKSVVELRFSVKNQLPSVVLRAPALEIVYYFVRCP